MKCCIPICNIPIQCFSFMPEIEDARMYLCIEGKTALVIDPSLSEEAFVLLKQAGVEDVTVLTTSRVSIVCVVPLTAMWFALKYVLS